MKAGLLSLPRLPVLLFRDGRDAPREFRRDSYRGETTRIPLSRPESHYLLSLALLRSPRASPQSGSSGDPLPCKKLPVLSFGSSLFLLCPWRPRSQGPDPWGLKDHFDTGESLRCQGPCPVGARRSRESHLGKETTSWTGTFRKLLYVSLTRGTHRVG